jgi:hypothetical protein
MEATEREMPQLVDREVLAATDDKINSIYEEPLASAQRKRWLNSVHGYQRVLPGSSLVQVHDAAENV